MYSYAAYGLGIQSALALPELLPGPRAPDVVVRLGCVGRGAVAVGSLPGVRAGLEETELSWNDVGRFAIRGGVEVVVEPAGGADEATLRAFLLGPALAVLLHQRGRLVLHASAVRIGEGAVAFLGGQGWGKSTTAAALYARGHALVADDVAAFDVDGMTAPHIVPGFPQLKVWPEVATSLGDDLGALSRLHPQTEKRARPALRGFTPASLPCRRLYVLAGGPRPLIEPLSPREGLLELVRHSYGVQVLHAVRPASYFEQCAALARSVPVHRLRVPRALAALPLLPRLVEDDLGDTAP